MEKRRIKSKVIASVVTLLVLGLLVFAGPAQAFSISLDIPETTAEQGKKIELTATVKIDSGEAYDIDHLVLVLTGPETIECAFDITGKMKAGVNEMCHGINIKKIPLPQIEKGYGYGYSYGYGYTEQELTYEITLHTQKFKVGTYETSFLVVMANGDELSQDGLPITIEPKETGKITEAPSQENKGKNK